VADVDAHQLAIKVDEAFAFRCPEINALRARHRNRIDSGLRGPFKERVAATEIDDFFAVHGFSRNSHKCRDAIRKRYGLTMSRTMGETNLPTWSAATCRRF
jgi:hypothetical protein